MNSVNIVVDYLKVANYALFHNGIPVSRSVELTLLREEPMEDVRVSVAGEYVLPFDADVIPRLVPGQPLKISPFTVAPDPAKLSALTERVTTSFTVSVRTADGDLVDEKSFELELMPYDHWTGTTILPQTIASFVTPNHPAVNSVITRTAEIMKNLTGSSTLYGYLSGDPADVSRQVSAVFAAIHSLGIIYRTLPGSYEEVGQRITLPDRVIYSKIGNCIELTLLMATVLEAIGINPVIVFEKGHAYLGVWLVNDSFGCSVSDDASFIGKKCSRGIGEMLVVECTCMTHEKASFEEAVATAMRNLADQSKFEMFIDVRRCRLERIRPLPARVEVNGEWTFDTEGVGHDSCDLDLKEYDRYDLNRIISSTRELSRFDIWERKLLDFSLRNSLLNLSLRRRAIQFISFDVDRIEDHLQDGEEYCILPKPDVELKADTSDRLIHSSLHPELHELISEDIEHHRLHTFFTEAETRSVMRNIYRAARNAIEETGANSLFLSIGTLRWYETERSTMARYAPLLLLPVEMVYKKGNFYIRTRDEDITLNITLIEFLRQNYDIAIPTLGKLPRDAHGVDVPLIFAAVRDALKNQKGWDVEEECLLGTFSFNKFLMWNDVHSHREELQENEIIRSLVAKRLTWTPRPVATDLNDIDMTVSPADTALPVDADSSQMAAVIEAGEGNSFILYGPPGTGKSQTITNLIANALYHGKRVLFVAEKMAALSVVQSRLEKIGLDPFCLELHSNKSSKRHVLQQLEKALKVSHIMGQPDFAARAEKIFEERKGLIAYLQALHSKDAADGLSVYDCIVGYESYEGEPLDGFEFSDAVDPIILEDGIKGAERLLCDELSTALKLVGQPSRHPLKGLEVKERMIMNEGTVKEEMLADVAALDSALRESDRLKGARELREKILRDSAEAIFGEDPQQLRNDWREARSKWFIPRFFAKRRFMERMRQFNRFIREEEVDALLDDLGSYREKHSAIARLHEILSRRGRTVPAEDMLPESATIGSLAADLRRWAGNTGSMRDWYHWTAYSAKLRRAGLGSVVTALEESEHTPEEIRPAAMKALLRRKADMKMSRSAMLATFEGMIFDDRIAAYRRLTDEFQRLTRAELYARLAARVPRVTDNAMNASEIGLLNRNISNGGRGLSLRDLFDQLPTLMPRLCPCMLMSPMSAAQYIDITAEKFDLVVFDEASQMPTSEAVGAIARGKALVVVGDPKQMPPTSFFSSTTVDADEAYIDDMDSILEDCRTLEMPSLQLSWHYRSRHESLITFSNNEYYEGSLITFPSVDDRQTRVHHVPVKGVYEKGGKRWNRAEADAIIAEIARRLRDPRLRRRSIGVIAFSVMQQGLIEDLLQELLDKDKALQEAVAEMYEPIFVKNLENVQGDERDVILFSIGYGPDADGKVSMNFGPLNNAGGERRLNVAVSRARCEMYVFSTLKSSDIDLRRTQAKGVEGLKHFLEYAEGRPLVASGAAAASRRQVIAEEIAAELRKKGLTVTTGVGRSQFRVDVAVGNPEKPGRYSLGILLDGESYRDIPTTRDREVVQPSVLAGLDWKVMRIWSVDWYRNRIRVIDRIMERLNSGPENPNDEEPATVGPTFDISESAVEEYTTNAGSYTVYTAPSDACSDRELVSRIIATEQPITFGLLCRRVAAGREGQRVSPTLQRAVRDILGSFYQDEAGTIWLDRQSAQSYTGFRPDSGRDISEIPQIELINAITEVLTEQVALDEDNLTLAASKKLGFNRRGPNVAAAFRAAVEAMKTAGLLESSADRLRLKTN